MPEPSAGGGGSNILKQKVGGIPIWIIGAAGAVGAGVLVWYTNRGAKPKSSSSTDPNAAGNANSLYPVAPVTYVTGVPSSSPGSPTSSSTPSVPDTPINPADWSSLPDYAGLMYGKGTFIQGGQAYFHLDNPDAAQAYMDGGGQTYYFPQPGLPVPNAPTGSVMYGRVPATAASGAGGLGGAAVGPGIGGASPWQQMSQRHHVPHYWAGMGGGGLGAASKKSGLPLERLRSLNPRHKKGDLVRVA